MKLENKNPTEIEKKMFNYCGLYPVERNDEYIKYAQIHGSDTKINGYPTDVEISNKYIDFDSTVIFYVTCEFARIYINDYMDISTIQLIVDRCKELGWN